ncbi:Putative Helicase associated domain-containing protein [[Torrubiella] hemipterigena]|uniref:RNA helicase n=1 Tax=[Torrubiella] hemipterigena TaxID=1531966 RepID=A0A0A1T8J6_9HYPO|nr:Putative Helicase associated domain-containing protein [[Torrubiella] hemipterigena]
MADFDIDASFIPSLHKPAALLPVAKHKESLLYTVETFPITIIIGQTGSGKTTQIPQFLEQAGFCHDGKIIGVTQPRRVAATTVALRVAEEMGVEIGTQVGYSIRFEDVTSASTKIKFLTDGLLIREALVDPLLSRYSVIMVDEAHERSISTDILLGLLKKIKKKRPDLRIIISSATLQAESFLSFFSNGEDDQKDDQADNAGAPGKIVSIEGRTYPIDVMHLDTPAENYVDKAMDTVFEIHSQEDTGDILVFLTGREEIDYAIQAVAERAGQMDNTQAPLQPMPLYAGLTSEQQMYVFDRPSEGTRKVVFSTNIAEASVTIEGIVYVIDSGYVKLRAYDPKTGIESLVTTPISKASASQRAGRAGRTKPGKCYRLYTEQAYASLAEANPPEIQRSNLAPTILQLKALGIDNIVRFAFFSPPPAELVGKGLELLYSLGALDEYAKLTTPLGTRMAEIAVEPMMAKTLLSATAFGCVSEILTIAAMTSLGSSVWFYHEGERGQMESARRKFAAEEGDHLTLLNTYQAFIAKGKKEAKFCHENHLNYKSMVRAVSVRSQLKRYLDRFGIIVDETLSSKAAQNDTAGTVSKAEQIRRCLTGGYFAHAARMQADGTFRNVQGGSILHAHPSSVMFNRKSDWVIFHEIMQTGDKTYIRDITKIEKGWLLEYAPEFYKLSNR